MPEEGAVPTTLNEPGSVPTDSETQVTEGEGSSPTQEDPQAHVAYTGELPIPEEGEEVPTDPHELVQLAKSTEPETANNIEQEQEAAEAGEPTETPATQPQVEAGEARFDQHPRFQQLLSRAKAAEDRAKALEFQRQEEARELEELLKEPDYEDLTKLTNEQIIDKFNENPTDFIGNLAKQIRGEVMDEFQETQQHQQERQSEEAKEAEIMKAVNVYADANPDFEPLWREGKIQAVLEQYPAHNFMSAHLMLTLPQKMEAYANQKAEEAKAQQLRDFQTKTTVAPILGAGPSAPNMMPNPDDDPAFKNSKQYGGDVKVLLNRVLQRRQRERGG
jgi:hypothetical protein